ncbi:hypothetical protein P3S68_028260 [Capsicum galapagoense]
MEQCTYLSSAFAALFQSLLFEACERTMNPMHGVVGLLWMGVATSPAEFYSAFEENDVDLFRSQSSNFKSKRKVMDEIAEDLDLGLSPRTMVAVGGKLSRRTEKRRFIS